MKPMKITASLVLALLGTASVQGAQTNLVQTLRIDLLTFSQGASVTNGNIISTTINTGRISNRDIIAALGEATTNTFSPAAELLAIKPLPDGDPAIVIRDAGHTVRVTRFFTHDQEDVAANRARVNTATGVATGSEFSLHSFGLKDAANSPALGLHFRVAGLTRATFASLLDGKGGVIGEVYEYDTAVSGTADVDGVQSLAQGTVSGKGRRVEIVP